MTEDFESAIDAFPVKLEHFDGPLDLLLHLIKKNEVNIYDIPIALITQQYLDTIHLMQELNLDVAGDYLVMAATLIHIKSRMLLPRPETSAAVEGEEDDPRDSLVQRLLEHQKYKAAAGLLHEREQVRAAQWQRPDERVAGITGEDVEPELEVDLFSLLAAFTAPGNGRACCSRPSSCRSRRASTSCSSGCRRPRPADSRTCLPMRTTAGAWW
jgi:segregation and condensation protein A